MAPVDVSTKRHSRRLNRANFQAEISAGRHDGFDRGYFRHNYHDCRCVGISRTVCQNTRLGNISRRRLIPSRDDRLVLAIWEDFQLSHHPEPNFRVCTRYFRDVFIPLGLSSMDVLSHDHSSNRSLPGRIPAPLPPT